MNNKSISFSIIAIYFGICLPLVAEELRDSVDASIKSLIKSHNITGNPETDLPVEPITSP